MADSLPKVDAEQCIGCGACVGACPSDLFELVDDKARFKVENKDDCVHCEACIGACPNGAISMQPAP